VSNDCPVGLSGSKEAQKFVLPALPDNPRDRIAHPPTFRPQLAAQISRRLLVIALNPSVVVVGYVMQTRGLTAQAALDPISARRQLYLSPGIEVLLTRSWGVDWEDAASLPMAQHSNEISLPEILEERAPPAP
jgi:hypothetical protein